MPKYLFGVKGSTQYLGMAERSRRQNLAGLFPQETLPASNSAHPYVVTQKGIEYAVNNYIPKLLNTSYATDPSGY